jgi:transposase
MVRKAVGQVSLVRRSCRQPRTATSGWSGSPYRWTGSRARRCCSRCAAHRPAYPPLVQKALLLQQWYHLSDRDLEEALADRSSFRRFRGLGLEDAVPDATLSRFRIDLAEAACAALNAQPEQRGLFLEAGTMIDASLVLADVQRPPMREGKVSERSWRWIIDRRQDDRSIPGRAAVRRPRRGQRPDPQGDPHQTRRTNP